MKKKYVYFVILFIFVIFFKFFENAYIVFKNNHEVRLISNYGFCDKSSYGFIKYIDKININVMKLDKQIQFLIY